MSDTSNLLHRLWTKASGADGYDKSEWLALERAIAEDLSDRDTKNAKLRTVLKIACEQLESVGWAKPPAPGRLQSNEYAVLTAWRRLLL